MPRVTSDGVRIQYRVLGAGDALVLIHGFTASAATNFESPGWFDALAPHYRLIVPDLRGHGLSEKPHHQADYSLDLMARDVLACMDAEGITRPARIFGYSMGAMVALELLLNHPERISAAVIGGMGDAFPNGIGTSTTCRDQELAPIPPAQRRGLVGDLKFLKRYFRHFDPLALHAVNRAVFRGRTPVDVSRLDEIRAPVLCCVGTRDRFWESATHLARRIPGARLVTLSGRGHISAISDPRFKHAVLDFLAEIPSGAEHSATTTGSLSTATD